jgi:predicted phage terminase large subunit-like protein
VLAALTERDDTQTQVDAWETTAARFRARRLSASLYEFMREGWHVVEPSVEFVGNWHLEKICTALEQVGAGDIERAIINQPPGTCKTRTLLFWTAHLLARDPRRRVLIVTYGDDFSTKFASDIRTLMRSPWFQNLFPMRFKRDQDEKSYFATIDGGWCLATSVGGKGQGLHPDFIILDDPIKAMDAKTIAGRDEVWSWYTNTLASRGMTRNVRLVASGQRLDVDDFFGRLLASPAKGSWTHVRFPMRYEPSRPPTDQEPEGYQADPLDPRTQDGELLWPALVSEEKVKLKEMELAEDAPAQLQQHPQVKGGRLFKTDMLRFYEPGELPAEMVLRRGWDTGATEGGGDPTAGVKMGAEVGTRIENGLKRRELTNRYFVTNAVREQLGPDGVDRLMLVTAQADGIRCGQREEREGGSSGKAVTNARARLMRGLDYEEVTKHVNKVMYSKPFRSQVNAGNVYLPKGEPWVADFISELRDFPAGSHDDQVDAASTAFNALILADLAESVECTW